MNNQEREDALEDACCSIGAVRLAHFRKELDFPLTHNEWIIIRLLEDGLTTLSCMIRERDGTRKGERKARLMNEEFWEQVFEIEKEAQ